MRAFAIELLCYGFKEDRTQVIGNKHIHLSLYKYRYLSMSAWFYIIYNSKTSGFTLNSSLRCPDTKARNDSLISIRLSVSIYWLKIKEWLMSKRHQRNQLKLIDCKHGKLLFILKNTQFTKRKRVCQLHLKLKSGKWLIFFVIFLEVRLMIFNKNGYYLQ